MMNEINRFVNEEDGMGTLEIVIIIAVLLSLALLFKGKIQEMWRSLTGTLDTEKGKLGNIEITNE